jgi:hypothetical protein
MDLWCDEKLGTGFTPDEHIRMPHSHERAREGANMHEVGGRFPLCARCTIEVLYKGYTSNSPHAPIASIGDAPRRLSGGSACAQMPVGRVSSSRGFSRLARQNTAPGKIERAYARLYVLSTRSYTTFRGFAPLATSGLLDADAREQTRAARKAHEIHTVSLNLGFNAGPSSPSRSLAPIHRGGNAPEHGACPLPGVLCATIDTINTPCSLFARSQRCPYYSFRA